MPKHESAFVTIRMKPEDITRIDKAAKEDERTRSSWLRKLVLDELDGKRNAARKGLTTGV